MPARCHIEDCGNTKLMMERIGGNLVYSCKDHAFSKEAIESITNIKPIPRKTITKKLIKTKEDKCIKKEPEDNTPIVKEEDSILPPNIFPREIDLNTYANPIVDEVGTSEIRPMSVKRKVDSANIYQGLKEPISKRGCSALTYLKAGELREKDKVRNEGYISSGEDEEVFEESESNGNEESNDVVVSKGKDIKSEKPTTSVSSLAESTQLVTVRKNMPRKDDEEDDGDEEKEKRILQRKIVSVKRKLTESDYKKHESCVKKLAKYTESEEERLITALMKRMDCGRTFATITARSIKENNV